MLLTQQCFGRVLEYVHTIDMLTRFMPLCRSLRDLVDTELCPVVVIDKHRADLQSLEDGSRVHLRGGVCAQVIVRGRCRITGSGKIHTLQVTHRDDRAWVAGITIQRLMVSRGAAVLRHCRIEGVSNHCVVTHRSSLRMWHCVIRHENLRTQYMGLYCRRSIVDIRDCVIERCFAGICLEDCLRSDLLRVKVTACREGLVAQRCKTHSLRVESLSAADVSMGIQLIDCAQEARLAGCSVSTHASGTALLVQGAGSPTIRHSLLQGAISMLDRTSCLFHHNTVTGPLRISYSGPIVIDNHLSGKVVVRGSTGLIAHNTVDRDLVRDSGQAAQCEMYSNYVTPAAPTPDLAGGPLS